MTRAKSLFGLISNWILKNLPLMAFISLLIIGSLIYFGIFKKTSNNLETYTVTREKLEEVVFLTGRVVPSQEANLTFEKTGVIKTLNVSVGDQVLVGQTLATLSGEDEFAKVLEAKANFSSQQAILEDLKTGSRPETIQIKKLLLEKNSLDIAQSYKNAGDSLKNINISANTYVRDNLANFFSGSFNEGYRLNVASCDSISESKVNVLKKEAEESLKQIDKLSTDYVLSEQNTENQDKIILEIKSNLVKKISEYLNSLKDLFSSSCLNSNTNFDSARSLILASRNSWSSLLTDLSVKTNLIENLKIAKNQAGQDLNLSLSGEKNEKIKSQEALVNSSLARITQANANANKNILIAPFSGVITNIDLKKGELVSPGGKTISLISTNNFQIESKVSEIDVSKLSTSSKALVTFDSYGDNANFEAIVSNISLAGIISEGVPTYKTIFTFPVKDERVRSGMTANLKVITQTHENVLAIPAKFVINTKGLKSVKVQSYGDVSNTISKEIKLGVRGVNGEVEVLEGLKEGDIVVLEKNN